MQSKRRAEGGNVCNSSTLGFKNPDSKPIGLVNVSDQDLLTYMADLLLELEEMAVAQRFDGLADLLGYAHRETQRNRKAK